MRNRHVEVQGANITFTFQGKSRVHHTINLRDRRLANIIKRCSYIPGYELFQYLSPDGDHHSVDSADVNSYLYEIAEHTTALRNEERALVDLLQLRLLLQKLANCCTIELPAIIGKPYPPQSSSHQKIRRRALSMNEVTPDHILQVGTGFWASKTLLSAVEMELFTELAKHPEHLDPS